jgi:hypothetical protein
MTIELKIGKFLPEYVGKMQFYLAVLNDTVRLSMIDSYFFFCLRPGLGFRWFP